LKRRLIVLVTMAGVVMITVSIVVMFYSGISAKPPILTISNGTLKISLLEVQRGNVFQILSLETRHKNLRDNLRGSRVK